MITFLVVGRNDNYGVNLHKRTAISLNYFASLCSDPHDEIVYVDCNTPEHEPTLVEAIADTLTPEAQQRIKVFRIHGQQMLKAIGETPLPFSDELSRNVGIRRSNPNNDWLLSTNCDILVHPIATPDLHSVLRGLEPRFYVCPRISIPISQWQMLSRMNVAQISSFCDATIQNGFRFPPEKEQCWLRFGSIGDFQLAPREQWFQIQGCEEGMKLWGHSDVNNSKRLSILNGGGRTPDLAGSLLVLHLDHNPTVAVSHQNTLLHNDWKRWVDDVTDYSSHNAQNWGLADTDIPAIRLHASATMDGRAILAAHRRPRRLLESIRLRSKAAIWRKVSPFLNWLDNRLRKS
jgi:hypothetical protein